MKDRSRAEDIAGGLASGDADARLKSLRAIKNNVIGSKREKTKHLLYLPSILEILSKDQEADVLIQAAQAIGSFASAPDGAKALIGQGGVPTLLLALKHPDIRVIEACARALKLLYTKTPDISRKEVNELIQTPGSDTTLVNLLSIEEHPSIGESAAWIIARCCELDTKDETEPTRYFLGAGVLKPLIKLLQDSTHRHRQAAALSAIATLTRYQPCVRLTVLDHPNVVFDLLNCVKSSIEAPRMRFTACVCLTNLLPQINRRNNHVYSDAVLLPSKDEVEGTVLPVLVRLMNEESTLQKQKHTPLVHKPEKINNNINSSSKPKGSGNLAFSSSLPKSTLNTIAVKHHSSVASEVPGVLLQLLAGKPSLHVAAVDADAILRLTELIKSPHTLPKGKVDSLLVLGMLTETVESHRRKLVDCGALPAIAAALTDSSMAVRGAACCCMKSLSRSTRLLRCSLGSLNDIAAPLLELSRSDDSSISTEAAATLANMAIEYSSLKEQVLVLQGITRFVELTEAKSGKLRLYGVWGLSSAVYLATEEIKTAVMRAFPWGRVVGFLSGSDQHVKEKTLLLLRNLAHRGGGGVASAAAAATGAGTGAGPSSFAVLTASTTPAAGTSPSFSLASCTTVLEWSQGDFLLKVLYSIRGAYTGSMSYEDERAKQFEHALYAVVNLSSGPPSDKDAVGNLISDELGTAIKVGLHHGQDSIREAAVWVIINLTWGQDDEDPGLAKRRQDLIEKNLVNDLRGIILRDDCMRVRERASTALVQLFGGSGPRMEEEEDDEEEEGVGAGGILGERFFFGVEGEERAALIGRFPRRRGIVYNVEMLHAHADDAMDEGEDGEDFMEEDDEEKDNDGDDGEGLPW